MNKALKSVLDRLYLVLKDHDTTLDDHEGRLQAIEARLRKDSQERSNA